MYLFIILIFLGIVQGIAEFLPISSSGHLVILQQIDQIKVVLDKLGDDINLFLNVALHIASLLAVIIFLWKDIVSIFKGLIRGIASKDFQKPEVKISVNIIAASIPAGIIGILFHDEIAAISSSATSAFIMLIINGFVLILTKKIPVKDRKIEEVGLVRSITVGFFQAFAILPGISRSGMTIAGGMFNGLRPVESAKFSFLMAIPVIAGAGFFEGLKAAKGNFPEELIVPLIIAMIITLIVALFSLRLLFALVKKIKINIFGYYTILLGICGLILIKVIY